MCLPSFLTLTVSAVVVFAAFQGPGSDLTNSLTANQAEMIVQVTIPTWVAPKPGARVQTTLRLSLEESKNDIYLYIVHVLYKLLMFRQVLPCHGV